MNEELIFKAQFLQKQTEELENNVALIDREIEDLGNLDKNLEFLMNSKEKVTISTIGKGIHVKTTLESKDLLVEVGAGVIVKKSPQEARSIIENQIKKLTEARFHVMNKLDIYSKTMESLMVELEQEQAKERAITSGNKS